MRPDNDPSVQDQTLLYADARQQGLHYARANPDAQEPQHHQIRMPRTLGNRNLQEATWRAYFIDGWRDVRPVVRSSAVTARAAAPSVAVPGTQERRLGLALVGYDRGSYGLNPESVVSLLGPLGINSHHPRYTPLLNAYNAAHREAGSRGTPQRPLPPPPPPASGWSLFWWIGVLDGRSGLHRAESAADLNAAADLHLQSIFGAFGTINIETTSGSHPDTFRAHYRVGFTAGREQRGSETNLAAGRRDVSSPARRPPTFMQQGIQSVQRTTSPARPGRQFGLALLGYDVGLTGGVVDDVTDLLRHLGITNYHPRLNPLIGEYMDARRLGSRARFGNQQVPLPPPRPPLRAADGRGLLWWIGVLDGRARQTGPEADGALAATINRHLDSIFGGHDESSTRLSELGPAEFARQYREGYAIGLNEGESSPPDRLAEVGVPRWSTVHIFGAYRRANGTWQRASSRTSSPARSDITLPSPPASSPAPLAATRRHPTPPSQSRRYGFAALGWQDGFSDYNRRYATNRDDNPGFNQAIQAFTISRVGERFHLLESQYNASYNDGHERSSTTYSGGPTPPPPPHTVTAEAFMRRLGSHDRIYYQEELRSNAIDTHLRNIYGSLVPPDWRHIELVNAYQRGLRTPPPPLPPPSLPQPLRRIQLHGPVRIPGRQTSPPSVSRPSSTDGHARIIQPVPHRTTHLPAALNPGGSRRSSRSSLSNDDLYANPSPPPPPSARPGPITRVTPLRTSTRSLLTGTQQLRAAQTTRSGGTRRPPSARSTLSRIRPDSSLASSVRAGTQYIDAGTQVPLSGVPTQRRQVQQRRSLHSLLRPNPPAPTSGLTIGSGVSGTFRRTSQPPGSALSRFARPGQQTRR